MSSHAGWAIWDERGAVVQRASKRRLVQPMACRDSGGCRGSDAGNKGMVEVWSRIPFWAWESRDCHKRFIWVAVWNGSESRAAIASWGAQRSGHVLQIEVLEDFQMQMFLKVLATSIPTQKIPAASMACLRIGPLPRPMAQWIPSNKTCPRESLTISFACAAHYWFEGRPKSPRPPPPPPK